MIADLDLIDHVKFGYLGNSGTAPQGSADWIAQKLGVYLHHTGRVVPRYVRRLRPRRFDLNDMTFEYSIKAGVITFERIS